MTGNPTDDRLITFAELLASVPVRERTLRLVLAQLGYRRAPGRGRLLFDAADVAAVIAAIKVPTPPPAWDTRKAWRQAREVRGQPGNRPRGLK